MSFGIKLKDAPLGSSSCLRHEDDCIRISLGSCNSYNDNSPMVNIELKEFGIYLTGGPKLRKKVDALWGKWPQIALCARMVALNYMARHPEEFNAYISNIVRESRANGRNDLREELKKLLTTSDW